MPGESNPEEITPDSGEPISQGQVFVDVNGEPYPAKDQLVLRRIWQGIEHEIRKDLSHE